MLPAPHRLRLQREFAVATRRGRRAGAGTLVVHLARPTAGTGPAAGTPAGTPAAPARVGVVVSRACGSAVVRNRIKRRLRHRVQLRLSGLPAGAIVVVRALPAAAEASSPHLDADLTYCLDRLLPTTGGGAAA